MTAMLLLLQLVVGQSPEINEQEILSRIENRLTRRDSCGPVSLWYCLRWFGHSEDVSNLVQTIPKIPGGVQLEQLAAFSNTRGLPCTVVKFPPSKLAQLPVPAILVINDNHCVVYLGRDLKTQDYKIFEPLTGQQGPEKKKSLESASSGLALVFTPAQSSYSVGDYLGFGSLFLLLFGISCVWLRAKIKADRALETAS